jgi:hypothetical protein
MTPRYLYTCPGWRDNSIKPGCLEARLDRISFVGRATPTADLSREVQTAGLGVLCGPVPCHHLMFISFMSVSRLIGQATRIAEWPHVVSLLHGACIYNRLWPAVKP